MQGYCDVYKWTILKRTSPEVKCLHPTSSRREMCTSSVSNVIYHKFSHGAAFYTLKGKNVNVMLELGFSVHKMILLFLIAEIEAILFHFVCLTFTAYCLQLRTTRPEKCDIFAQRHQSQPITITSKNTEIFS